MNIFASKTAVPETVDQILSAFTTTVAKLKERQAHVDDLTVQAQAEAYAAQQRAEQHAAESARASTAIKKIESFLA